MEPISIAIISTVIFGAVASLSAFIRHVMLSRDQRLNEQAQQRALSQEARELETLRTQMENPKRFTTHYQMLGENKDAIHYLDTKIEEVLAKKLALVNRYAEMTIKESVATVAGGIVSERQSLYQMLKDEMDIEIKHYDTEHEQLQKRRSALWDSHFELQDLLVGQERSRNQKLDEIYETHSGILAKVYARHEEAAENIVKESINANKDAYKLSFLAPIQMMIAYFKATTGIGSSAFTEEKEKREMVRQIENELNNNIETQATDKTDKSMQALAEARAVGNLVP